MELNKRTVTYKLTRKQAIDVKIAIRFIISVIEDDQRSINNRWEPLLNELSKQFSERDAELTKEYING